MITTVRCSCRGRVALFDCDVPALWFVDTPRARARGPVETAKKRAAPWVSGADGFAAQFGGTYNTTRAVIFTFDHADKVGISQNRELFWHDLTFAQACTVYQAWCQGCPLHYDLADVRRAAEQAAKRGRTSTTLHAPSATVTDN